MRYILLLSSLFLSAFLHAQLNAELVGNLRYDPSVNDVWGWVDTSDNNTEYAIVGLQNGVSVVSLADPSNPREVGFASGPSSGWRDMKTWGNFGYAINETGAGLLVMDLSAVPDSLPFYYWAPLLPELGTLSTCHNLYIDEFGVAYLTGCNLNNGGPIMVDVASDPGNPIYIGRTPNRYAHDVYARNNLLYTSDIYDGIFSVYDVSDKQSPEFLGSAETPFLFTHNVWLSDDGQTAYTTDERANAPVAAYDISNFDNIQKIDEFRPTETINTGVIPHNVHVIDDFLSISHYSDGLVVVDAQRPNNLIEVANYDTFRGQGQGFSGAWGAYPFLPSGLTLVSDRSNGLFVVDVDYVSAAYLEGLVRDKVSGDLLGDVRVELDAPKAKRDFSNFQGEFATGTPTSGTYSARFSKLGYRSATVEVDLSNGEVTELEVELEPRIRIGVFGTVVDEENGNPISNAKVAVVGEEITYTAETNERGEFTITDVFEGEYEVVLGAWGYRQKAMSISGAEDITVEVQLKEGYEDDFALDLGWEVIDGAETGNWELGEPIGTLDGEEFFNPEFDLDDDLGNQCYVTGNGGGGIGTDDVDNGVTTLLSPWMDLTDYTSPELSYQTWFINAGGNSAPNDFLSISITNQIDTILIDEVRGFASSWRPRLKYELAFILELTDSMRLIVETSDLQASGHLVEAAFDGFLVEEGDAVNTAATLLDVDFGVHPNPFSDQLWLDLPELNNSDVAIQIYNNLGQIIHREFIDTARSMPLNLANDLSSGVYWIQLIVDGQSTIAKRVIKQ
ncbi:MAG: choice-of-anchor B family protein [Bacteroidota bacterium]